MTNDDVRPSLDKGGLVLNAPMVSVYIICPINTRKLHLDPWFTCMWPLTTLTYNTAQSNSDQIGTQSSFLPAQTLNYHQRIERLKTRCCEKAGPLYRFAPCLSFSSQFLFPGQIPACCWLLAASVAPPSWGGTLKWTSVEMSPPCGLVVVWHSQMNCGEVRLNALILNEENMQCNKKGTRLFTVIIRWCMF